MNYCGNPVRQSTSSSLAHSKLLGGMWVGFGQGFQEMTLRQVTVGFIKCQLLWVFLPLLLTSPLPSFTSPSCSEQGRWWGLLQAALMWEGQVLIDGQDYGHIFYLGFVDSSRSKRVSYVFWKVLNMKCLFTSMITNFSGKLSHLIFT